MRHAAGPSVCVPEHADKTHMWWTCLLFPELPLDAVRTSGQPRDQPVVLVDGPARQLRVVLANAAARRDGVRIGQPLAAARACLPELISCQRDPAAEQRLLTVLADWACRFSGQVSLAPPRALLIEVGASLTLFDGWPALQRRLLQELDLLDYSCRMATAPTPAGARVLAANRNGLAVTNHQQLLHALGDIALQRCGLSTEVSKSLIAMGLRRLRDVFQLPRPELARRVGPATLVQLDRMRGLAAEALVSYQPASTWQRRIEFEQAIENVQALAFPLQRLLRELAVFLSARDASVQQFQITLEHENNASTHVPVGLLNVQRDAAILFESSRVRLERIELVAAVIAIRVLAEDLPTPCLLHDDLFAAGANETTPWPVLAERLRARLGDESVHALTAVSDHRPERAWRRLQHAFTPLMPAPSPSRRRAAAAPTSEISLQRGPRPLWLLPRAIPLRPVPTHILAGPERIETGWWDDDDQRRDYYVVQTQWGQRAWAFLAAGNRDGWMLQGWFA